MKKTKQPDNGKEGLQDKHTPEKLTLFVTGTGYREELGKNDLLLRTDDNTIHLHKESYHLLAHTLVDRYNNYQSLVEALEAIKARIDGEYDNHSLLKFGLLTHDVESDVYSIIKSITPKS